MTLETIYVTRHGFRSNWSVDHTTGVYTSSIPTPTGIAADPALTSHGVDQAKEMGRHLSTLDPPIEAVYSSPYYRCIQTINPFVDQVQSTERPSASKIRAEHGLCEWFGSAPFEHPQPASTPTLKGHFPALDEEYRPSITPSTKGETLVELQERVARAVQAIVDRCDADGTRVVVLCTHAAVVISLGRVLTGAFPDKVETDDFHAYTCGLSVFRRRRQTGDERDGQEATAYGRALRSSYPAVASWNCELNSDCSFLSSGEERGWSFTGDESFPGTGSLSQDIADPKL